MINEGDHAPITLDVSALGSEIGDVNDLFRFRQTSQRDMRIVRRRDNWFSPPEFLIRGRRVLHGDEAKGTVVVDKQIAESCLANTNRVLQHGAEHRLELAWRLD